jgi:hypothetical protein
MFQRTGNTITTMTSRTYMFYQIRKSPIPETIIRLGESRPPSQGDGNVKYECLDDQDGW